MRVIFRIFFCREIPGKCGFKKPWRIKVAPRRVCYTPTARISRNSSPAMHYLVNNGPRGVATEKERRWHAATSSLTAVFKRPPHFQVLVFSSTENRYTLPSVEKYEMLTSYKPLNCVPEYFVLENISLGPQCLKGRATWNAGHFLKN